MVVINIVDHNLLWSPPTEQDCSDWIALTGLEDTVVLRERADWYQFQTSTAQAYGGDHYMLLLLDRDREVRLRWGVFWNEADLAPTIDDILAE